MSTIITLILIALLLFVFEIFMPGGVLAMIGALIIFWACFIAHAEFGLAVALYVFFLSAFLSIGIIVFGLKFLPQTRFGKSLFLRGKIKGTSNIPQATDAIIGKTGETLTALVPTGMVTIDGKKYEAFSQSGFLQKGNSIKVVKRDNFRLIVEKL